MPIEALEVILVVVGVPPDNVDPAGRDVDDLRRLRELATHHLPPVPLEPVPELVVQPGLLVEGPDVQPVRAPGRDGGGSGERTALEILPLAPAAAVPVLVEQGARDSRDADDVEAVLAPRPDAGRAGEVTSQILPVLARGEVVRPRPGFVQERAVGGVADNVETVLTPGDGVERANIAVPAQVVRFFPGWAPAAVGDPLVDHARVGVVDPDQVEPAVAPGGHGGTAGGLRGEALELFQGLPVVARVELVPDGLVRGRAEEVDAGVAPGMS